MSSVSFQSPYHPVEWRRRQKPEERQYLNAFEKKDFLLPKPTVESTLTQGNWLDG